MNESSEIPADSPAVPPRAKAPLNDVGSGVVEVGADMPVVAILSLK